MGWTEEASIKFDYSTMHVLNKRASPFLQPLRGNAGLVFKRRQKKGGCLHPLFGSSSVPSHAANFTLQRQLASKKRRGKKRKKRQLLVLESFPSFRLFPKRLFLPPGGKKKLPDERGRDPPPPPPETGRNPQFFEALFPLLSLLSCVGARRCTCSSAIRRGSYSPPARYIDIAACNAVLGPSKGAVSTSAAVF